MMTARTVNVRLTPVRFFGVWTAVKDNPRAASALGYSLPADPEILECMGFRGDEIPARRIKDFIDLNHIELVEEEDFTVLAQIPRPVWENGAMRRTPEFMVAGLLHHVMDAPIYPNRLIPAAF